jgi:hypothetical protein
VFVLLKHPPFVKDQASTTTTKVLPIDWFGAGPGRSIGANERAIRTDGFDNSEIDDACDELLGAPRTL